MVVLPRSGVRGIATQWEESVHRTVAKGCDGRARAVGSDGFADVLDRREDAAAARPEAVEWSGESLPEPVAYGFNL